METRNLDVERWPLCVVRFRAAFLCNSKVTLGMMLWRTGPPRLRYNLIQQPTSPVPAVTDPSRDPAQPNFQRRAQRIWKENRDVKTRLLPERTHIRQKRLIR